MAHLKTVSATTKNWSDLPSDVIAVGVFSKGELSPTAKDVDENLGGQLKTAVKNGDMTGRKGESMVLYGEKHRLIAVGLGEKKKLDLEQIRRASGKV
ncbi:MAG: M17 family peptidase N-terminal domain-containing protein, partial [Candidatus Neomarinimicrobiota bacterium]|nr:M17 family peptidase N-terminal domain-containing protein [Candidatus Neomarinimicrobiota bacterium]